MLKSRMSGMDHFECLVIPASRVTRATQVSYASHFSKRNMLQLEPEAPIDDWDLKTRHCRYPMLPLTGVKLRPMTQQTAICSFCNVTVAQLLLNSLWMAVQLCCCGCRGPQRISRQQL